MGTFSATIEAKVLDEIFGGFAYTPTTSLYVGLSDSTITSSGFEYVGNEPSTDTGYARVHIDNTTSTNWTDAETSADVGVKFNAVAITFPVVAASSWPNVSYAFIVTASCSTGELICWGALTTDKDLAVGDTASFAAGAFKITLD